MCISHQANILIILYFVIENPRISKIIIKMSRCLCIFPYSCFLFTFRHIRVYYSPVGQLKSHFRLHRGKFHVKVISTCVEKDLLLATTIFSFAEKRRVRRFSIFQLQNNPESQLDGYHQSRNYRRLFESIKKHTIR